MPKKYKLFIDSSALIAGLNSPTGGAGIILSGYLSGDFFVYISEQVIEEVQKNIQLKFRDFFRRKKSTALQEFQSLIEIPVQKYQC
ncbi:hypothetical protein KKH59_02285 [Patescibacteria group bacterium]|nr:hypothetical protein [Patescibacteria group bacterium]